MTRRTPLRASLNSCQKCLYSRVSASSAAQRFSRISTRGRITSTTSQSSMIVTGSRQRSRSHQVRRGVRALSDRLPRDHHRAGDCPAHGGAVEHPSSGCRPTSPLRCGRGDGAALGHRRDSRGWAMDSDQLTLVQLIQPGLPIRTWNLREPQFLTADRSREIGRDPLGDPTRDHDDGSLCATPNGCAHRYGIGSMERCLGPTPRLPGSGRSRSRRSQLEFFMTVWSRTAQS